LKTKIAHTLVLLAAIAIGAVSIMFPATVEGSEFRVQPSLVLSEEYNDNVLLTTEDAIDDYITGVAPALSLLYLAPKWDWDVDYIYNYRFYANETIDDDKNHTLDLTNRNRIISNFLFLDVKDQYTRISLDVLRDFAQESNFVNQSDTNVFSVSPFIVVTPLSQVTVTAGYIYMDTWFKDETAIDRSDHIGYADVRRDMSPRSALTAGIKHTQDINRVEDYSQDDVSLGLYYEYADNSTIMAKAGNSWFEFERADGTERASQVFWDAVVTQRYPTITVIYETGLRFIQDPLQSLTREDRYLVTISRDVERNSLLVSGGLLEYRDAEFKHLENTRYRVQGSIRHNLTTRSVLTLDLTAERLKNYPTGDSTDRYFTGARLEHQFMEDLSLALDYRFTNVYAPDEYLQNYSNNRFTVELRKDF
jgi:hypothetical protein